LSHQQQLDTNVDNGDSRKNPGFTLTAQPAADYLKHVPFPAVIPALAAGLPEKDNTMF